MDYGRKIQSNILWNSKILKNFFKLIFIKNMIKYDKISSDKIIYHLLIVNIIGGNDMCVESRSAIVIKWHYA